MDLIIAVRPGIDRIISELLFWGKPELSILCLQLSVASSIVTFIGLYTIPIRWLLVFGLWGTILSQIELVKVLIQAVTLQLSETDFQMLY